MRTGIRRLGRRVSRPRFASVSLTELRDAVGCDVTWLPRNLTLVGRAEDGWVVHSEFDKVQDRLWALLRFLGHLLPRLPDPPFWMICCTADGWREYIGASSTYTWVDVGGPAPKEWDGRPGELPRLSEAQPWVACFAAHVGDPSAVLVPEAHYLVRQQYRWLFGAVRRERTDWDTKLDRGVFAGTAHGQPSNFLRPDEIGDTYARALLRDVAARDGLDIDVHLGRGGVSRRQQIAHRYLIDVDGCTRTYDAWAWKIASGSLVLSQESMWETWFTRQFSPWEHFVPLANDLSDLGEKIEWCRAHDAECRDIASRATARAEVVYDGFAVATAAAAVLRERLLAT